MSLIVSKREVKGLLSREGGWLACRKVGDDNAASFPIYKG